MPIEAASFSEIRDEFDRRVKAAVYCSMATVDRKGRPRSRVMHLVWEGPIGWAISWPASHKAKHLASHPYVSLAYIADKDRPVYVDASVQWIEDVSEQVRIWDLHRDTPPPLGFDPQPHYGSIENPYFGLLRFTPWRVELADLHGEAVVWRP